MRIRFPAPPFPDGPNVPDAARGARRRGRTLGRGGCAGEASRLRRRCRGRALAGRGACARRGVHARGPGEAHRRRRSSGRAIRSIAGIPAGRVFGSSGSRLHVLRGRGRVAERLRRTGGIRRHELGADRGDAFRERACVRARARDRARHPAPHREGHRSRQPLESSGPGGDPRGRRHRYPQRRGRPGGGSRGDRLLGPATDQLHPRERDGGRPRRHPHARRGRVRSPGDGGSVREAAARRPILAAASRAPLHASRHDEPHRGSPGPRRAASLQAAREARRRTTSFA